MRSIVNRHAWTGGRVIRTFLVTAVLVGSFFYLGRSLAVDIDEVTAWNIRPNWSLLLVSLIMYIVGLFLGAIQWQLLLHGLGYKLSTKRSAKIQLLSNIAKYAPGYVWQMLGKAYLSNKEGIPRDLLLTAMLLEIAFLVLTGSVVSLILWPLSYVFPIATSAVRQAFALLLPILSVPAIVILPRLLDLFWRKTQEQVWSSTTQSNISHSVGDTPYSPLASPLCNAWRYATRLWKRVTPSKGVRGNKSSITYGWQQHSLVLIIMLVTWLTLGVSFWCLVQSIYPSTEESFAQIMLAWPASTIAGLLVFFVPVGVGVRESVMTFLLSYAVPPPIATVVAVMSRMVSVVCDAIAFLIAWRM